MSDLRECHVSVDCEGHCTACGMNRDNPDRRCPQGRDKVPAALSAEPAQEMTDERIDAIARQIDDADIGELRENLTRKFARAVIAADRASRLPEMSDGDIKRLVCATFPEPYYQERADKLVRAAVEAYKALVRGKT